MSEPSLQEAARQGDLQAISTLVGRAFLSRNVTVEAEMQHGTLCLKIHPLSTLTPKHCTQTIIKVLNEIQPSKINSIQISEVGKDEKALIWTRFLTLKNSKFVDNTTSIKVSLGVFGVLIIGLLGYCSLPKPPASTSSTVASGNVQQEQSKSQGRSKWYEGGTLHNASALEWQEANYDDKLATCADFISGLWQNKKLKPALQSQIQSMEDIRTLAQKLVKEMDAAMKKDENSEENRKMYTNQKVSEMAALLMLSMGWLN
jgi:hypothetical protein